MLFLLTFYCLSKVQEIETETPCMIVSRKEIHIWLLVRYTQYLTIVLLNPDIPAFANSVDPDVKPTDLDLHCLPLSM